MHLFGSNGFRSFSLKPRFSWVELGRMMSFCGSDEEDRFFDSKEEVSFVSDSSSDVADGSDLNWVLSKFRYGVWIGNTDSVQERRSKFLEWTGLDLKLDQSDGESECQRTGSVDGSDRIFVDMNRILEGSGAVLRNWGIEDEFMSSRSSMSGLSNIALDFSNSGVAENFIFRIRNLDDGTEFVVDELEGDGILPMLRQVDTNQLFTIDEFHRFLGLSPFNQRIVQEEVEVMNCSVGTVNRRKKSWLKILGSCIVDRQVDNDQLMVDNLDQSKKSGVHRVRVHCHRKQSKDFSALYIGQEIQAHHGSITTMKFSLDGQYLASGGEDGVVRIWKVTESERTDDTDIVFGDPSCLYFMVNSSSELTSVFPEKQKMGTFRSIKGTPDSSCVILPPKIFRISEEPLHEFRGHCGNVLDLSWSKNKFLLSSSEDNSVCLWQVGCDRCIKVFSHNNYVTCVQFNPADDNYFISGSIDGKVRIWSIQGCQVVDWTDVREIVTAVCYRPDGQGGIVGSMEGNCRFYDASDNHLQLDALIYLHGKKKSPSKRITGFQFCPSDPRKLMVTSADSQIRVLDGVDVICKYSGIRSSRGQMSASFTSDGRHIISTSEGSSVYIWNHESPHAPVANQAKSIHSCERFFSNNASIAIPWSGVKCLNVDSCSSGILEHNRPCFGDSTEHVESGCRCHLNLLSNSLSALSIDGFSSRGQALFSEAVSKGSATWPEEKLPSYAQTVPPRICKSQYKFLKASCQSTVGSPQAWGLVIITAGLDGRIRSFHNYGLPVRFGGCHGRP